MLAGPRAQASLVYSLNNLIQPQNLNVNYFLMSKCVVLALIHLPYALDLVACGLDNISVQMSNRPLRLNMPKSEILFSLSFPQISSFPSYPFQSMAPPSAEARNLNWSPILINQSFLPLKPQCVPNLLIFYFHLQTCSRSPLAFTWVTVIDFRSIFAPWTPFSILRWNYSSEDSFCLKKHMF